MKKPLIERFQQLAGIKPLHELESESPTREPAPMGTEFKANLSSIMDTYAPYFILETMAKIYGERDYPEAEKYFKKMSWAIQDDLSAPEEKEVDLGDGPSSWYGQPGKQWTGD